MKNGTRSKQLLKAMLGFGALVLFAVSCMKQAERLQPAITSSEMPDPVPNRVSGNTFKDFSHKIPEHLQFECNICHKREPKGIKSQFGGHESCIGCHMNEWIDEKQAICSVCHADLNSEAPTVKAFPVNFKEGFNTVFDHGDHVSVTGCSDCHRSSGRGKTISSGFQAHADCYDCHKPENTNIPKDKNDSCNVCHKFADYIRTLPSQPHPRYIFSHQDHTSESCEKCHNVQPGLGQGKQVTNIRYLQHVTSPVNNCLQCHRVGGGAFSGNNQTDKTSCVRCHKNMVITLPEGSYSDTAEEAPATGE